MSKMGVLVETHQCTKSRKPAWLLFSSSVLALLQVEQSRFLVPPFTSGESVFLGDTRKQSLERAQAESPQHQGGTRSILANLR